MTRRAIGYMAVLAAAAALVAGCSKDDATPAGGSGNRPARSAPPPAAAPRLRPRPMEQDLPLLPDADGPTIALPDVPGLSVESEVDGPWADAKVGGFIKFRAGGSSVVTQEVVAVSETQVTLKVSTEAGGQRVSNTTTVPRKISPSQRDQAVGPGATWSQETLEVAGKEVACRAASVPINVGGQLREIRVYLSDDVPGGMVRSAEIGPDGEPRLVWELLDFAK
jgi:hypothetical protein